jgi:hypothetical protein
VWGNLRDVPDQIYPGHSVHLNVGQDNIDGRLSVFDNFQSAVWPTNGQRLHADAPQDAIDEL